MREEPGTSAHGNRESRPAGQRSYPQGRGVSHLGLWPSASQAASSQQPLSTHPAQVVDQPCLELDDPGVPGQPLILLRSVLMAASWGLLDPFSGLPALKHLASISWTPVPRPVSGTEQRLSVGTLNEQMGEWLYG